MASLGSGLGWLLKVDLLNFHAYCTRIPLIHCVYIVELPEMVLECVAVPHILCWECVRSRLTVAVVFLDTVVAQVDAPRQEKHT